VPWARVEEKGAIFADLGAELQLLGSTLDRIEILGPLLDPIDRPVFSLLEHHELAAGPLETITVDPHDRPGTFGVSRTRALAATGSRAGSRTAD
jgi:hypothetical protein